MINHLINPEAVAVVASAYSARDSEIIKGIAGETGSEIISFGSDRLAKAKTPMEMTFSPEKRADMAASLAFLASREGMLMIRRSASVRGIVFSVAMNRENIILP